METLSMVTIFLEMDLDTWLISADQEEIKYISKEMLCASIATDPVISQDFAEVGPMKEEVQ